MRVQMKKHGLQSYYYNYGYWDNADPTVIAACAYPYSLLESVRAIALECAGETCEWWCELLALVTLWSTYKYLVRAVLYAALVPGACLSEPMHILWPQMPLMIR